MKSKGREGEGRYRHRKAHRSILAGYYQREDQALSSARISQGKRAVGTMKSCISKARHNEVTSYPSCVASAVGRELCSARSLGPGGRWAFHGPGATSSAWTLPGKGGRGGQGAHVAWDEYSPLLHYCFLPLFKKRRTLEFLS